MRESNDMQQSEMLLQPRLSLPIRQEVRGWNHRQTMAEKSFMHESGQMMDGKQFLGLTLLYWIRGMPASSSSLS